MTIRSAAVLVALLFAAGCGGGGGVLSPLAPGVSGGAEPTSPAAPVVTLSVMPAQNILPRAGSTAQVVATISTGLSGVPVTYAGGCAGVASITPSTQTTGPNGATPAYTMTATVDNAQCIARFTAGTASATTTAAVGSPTPMPTTTASPSPVPTIGPLVVTPATITLGGFANPTTATISATQGGYSGAFGEIDTCTMTPFGGPPFIIATVAGGGDGPAATWAVTQDPPPVLWPGSGGVSVPDACTVTVIGAFGQVAHVIITSTTFGLVIESTKVAK